MIPAMNGNAEALQRLQGRLARNIVMLRTARGMTQEMLAERSGLDSRHIQKIEAREVNVTLRTLAALGRALEVDVDELLKESTLPRQARR
jgi:transcriptional regulator with XRE-family HTH domain